MIARAIADKIADGVYETLSDTTFCVPLTVRRIRDGRLLLEPTETDYYADVMTGDFRREAIARDNVAHEYDIHVAVRHRVAVSKSDADDHDQAELDAGDELDLLVEEIADAFDNTQFEDLEAVWTETKFLPSWSQKHWEQARQFTSILVLTFRLAD